MKQKWVAVSLALLGAAGLTVGDRIEITRDGTMRHPA